MNTYIVQIKWIPRDTEVSYGPLYRTVRRTKIAVVPVGFADGIRRALSNKGEMLIHGKRVPIIGKICCDHTILDVTDIEEVKVGDEVTILEGTEKNHRQQEIMQSCAMRRLLKQLLYFQLVYQEII